MPRPTDTAVVMAVLGLTVKAAAGMRGQTVRELLADHS